MAQKSHYESGFQTAVCSARYIELGRFRIQ